MDAPASRERRPSHNADLVHWAICRRRAASVICFAMSITPFSTVILRSHAFMLCPALLKPSTALLNSDENCMRRLSWSRYEKFLISFQYAFHQPLLPSSMQGGRLGSSLAGNVERQCWNFHGSLFSR